MPYLRLNIMKLQDIKLMANPNAAVWGLLCYLSNLIMVKSTNPTK